MAPQLIEYSFARTRFGEVVAMGIHGRICALEFTCAPSPRSSVAAPSSACRVNSMDSDNARTQTIARLRSTFTKIYPDCEILESGNLAQQAIQYFDTARQPYPACAMLLHGTVFQQKIWSALMQVEHGTTISYSQLARRAGCPTAIRAAASAVARNPISLLVPCHRIVRNSGSTGNYRWGIERKRAILEWEQQA